MGQETGLEGCGQGVRGTGSASGKWERLEGDGCRGESKGVDVGKVVGE